MKQKEAQSSNPRSRENKLRINNRPTPPEPPTYLDNTSSHIHSKPSFAEVTSGQKPAVTEPSITATKVLSIIHKLLGAAQECRDASTKDSIINTIMSIISEFLAKNE
ncbi:unnamed protein product [Macrosiphum euphorbiae]|uniref:Uncharacterized protein n=1 Tax=Macrosiphum euphorbiae TaxID=13131 RepID=A0AAV0XTM5_9HEMI|nr:unnamed protein product [Macrosiphum euphorbiae]